MFKGNDSARLGVPEPLVDGSESGVVFVVEERDGLLGVGFLGLSHNDMLALVGRGCNRARDGGEVAGHGGMEARFRHRDGGPFGAAQGKQAGAMGKRKRAGQDPPLHGINHGAAPENPAGPANNGSTLLRPGHRGKQIPHGHPQRRRLGSRHQGRRDDRLKGGRCGKRFTGEEKTRGQHAGLPSGGRDKFRPALHVGTRESRSLTAIPARRGWVRDDRRHIGIPYSRLVLSMV